MRILYITPHCFGLERSLPRALQLRGAEVSTIVYGEHNREKGVLLRRIYTHYHLVKKLKRAMDRLGWLNRLLARSLDRVNCDVLKAAAEFNPDVIFVTKGEVLSRATLQTLKKLCPLVVYYWDDPFLEHVSVQDGTRDVRYQNIRDSYDMYDLSFVYDEHYLEPLRKAGAKHPAFLLHSYDPTFFHPKRESPAEAERWCAEISFVGAPYANRIEILNALKHHDVAVWGAYFRWREFFDDYPFLKKQYRGEAAAPEAARIYRSSKISLNIHDTFQCRTSLNNRSFEIQACGGVQLVDDRQMLHKLFHPGQDMITFRSPAEAVERAAYFLSHETERTAIAANAAGSVQGHAVTDRADEIISLFGSVLSLKSV